MKPTHFPGNPSARWRLIALPGSPVAQAHVPVVYVPPVRRGRHNPNVPDIIPEPVARMTEIEDASFVVVDGGYPNSPPAPIALLTTKKIGQTVYQRTFGFNSDGDKSDHLRLQRRRMVIPPDPRTTIQLQLRARFGRAVQHWKALTDEERRAYDRRAAALKPWLEGLNLYIREYCRAHDVAEFTDDAEILRTTGVLPPLA